MNAARSSEPAAPAPAQQMRRGALTSARRAGFAPAPPAVAGGSSLTQPTAGSVPQTFPSARSRSGFGFALLAALLSSAPAVAQPYFVATTQASVSYGGDFTSNGSLLVVGQPLIGRMVNAAYMIDVGIVSLLYTPSGNLPIFWNTGTGNWNTAGNWLPTTVPNNDSNQTYSAFILRSDARVTLDTNPSITRLVLGSGAELEMNQDSGSNFRTLQLDGELASNAASDGTIRVNATSFNRQLTINDLRLEQSANGLIEVTGNGPTSVLRLVDSSVVGGQVRVSGGTARLELRNSFLSDTRADDGELRAENNGLVDIGTSVTGATDYVADGGTIRLAAGAGRSITGDVLQVFSGGRFEIVGDVVNNYTVEFRSIRLDSIGGLLRGSTPPVLASGPRSQISVAMNFTVEGVAAAAYHPSAYPTQIGGSFVNHCTTPAANGLDPGFETYPATFRFYDSGLPTTQPHRFELGGQDRGRSNPAGYVENFALRGLTIDPGRSVRLEDTFINHPATSQLCVEVLYVEDIDLGAGATLTIDCGRVYFKTLTAAGGATITLENNARLIGFGPLWDIDGNSLRQPADAAALVNALLFGPANDPARYYRADANDDGRVDGRDVQAFVTAYLGP